MCARSAFDEVEHVLEHLGPVRPRIGNFGARLAEHVEKQLELVRVPLRRSVQAAIACDCDLAAKVTAEQAELDRRYGEVHDQILAFIAQQAPVATDLRLAMALLHTNDRVERFAPRAAADSNPAVARVASEGGSALSPPYGRRKKFT